MCEAIYGSCIVHYLRDIRNCNMHDLDLSLELAKVKGKYANQLHIHNFIYGGNSNICIICHRSRDILNQNVHDLDL